MTNQKQNQSQKIGNDEGAHQPQDQLRGIDFCITSPPPWSESYYSCLTVFIVFNFIQVLSIDRFYLPLLHLITFLGKEKSLLLSLLSLYAFLHYDLGIIHGGFTSVLTLGTNSADFFLI